MVSFMLSRIPGIHVGTGKFLLSETVRSDCRVADDGRFRTRCVLGNWMAASVDSRCSPAHAYASSDAGVRVLFDGYLSEIVGGRHDPSPASSLLSLYLSEGLDLLLRLRGSYVGLIIDERNAQAHLFNDRRGSRPLFFRKDGHSGVLIGPEVALLARAAPVLNEIDSTAVCEFLLGGSYFDGRTLFTNIEKIPQGTVVTFSREAMESRRYWQVPASGGVQRGDEPDTVGRALDLFNVAMARLMRATSKQFLFLSGGMDSRMILGGLRAGGYRVPAVTYGTGEGDDAPIGRQLAALCGMDFEYFPIDTRHLQDHFIPASLVADCRAETIDTPPMYAIEQRLSARYNSFLNGDTTVLRGVANTTDEALTVASIMSFEHSSRLKSLLNPDTYRQAHKNIGVTIARMWDRAGGLDLLNFSEKTYFEQRLGNRSSAFTAARLRCMEPLQPWLDEDLVDFMFGVPAAMRARKRIVREMLSTAHPDLAAVAFAERESIPHAQTYRRIVPETPELANFIRNQFFDALDERLAALFKRRALLDFVEAILSGSAYPSLSDRWWSHLPGFWRLEARASAADRQHPVSLVLRLMQLNIYLQNIDRPYHGDNEI